MTSDEASDNRLMKPPHGNNTITTTIIAACLLVGMIYLPIIQRMTLIAYDYLVHIKLAEKMLLGGAILTPHFLLQAAVAAIAAIFTVTVQTATLSLLVIAVCAAAFIIARSIAKEVSSLSVIIYLTAALLLVAPLAVPFPFDKHLYLGYISTNVFHNPTMILLKPLALLSFGYAVTAIDNHERLQKFSWLLCGMTTIACALTKPSFTICILPAMALLILYRLFTKKSLSKNMLLFGFFLPALLVLALQFRMTYGSSQIQGVYSGSSQIIFAPLAVMQAYSSWLPAKLLLSLTFPLTLLLCYFRSVTKDTGLLLGWLAFFFGAAYTYLLAESGPRMLQGNFSWSAQIALFILFVNSARFLFGHERSAKTADRNKFYLCNGVLFLHLIFGIIFYVSEYLHTERYW